MTTTTHHATPRDVAQAHLADVALHGSVTATVETITPEQAALYLAATTKRNRNLREKDVAAYARDMLSGNWQVNGEAIQFDTNGDLDNGQHRLNACIRAGVPFTTVVVRGVDPAAQETMDGGIVRKFSDDLALRGVPNARTVAAIVRRVAQWEFNKRIGDRANYKPTRPELAATLARHPHLVEASELGHRVGRGCPLPPSLIGFAWWMFSQLEGAEEDIDWFFDRLSSGVELTEGHPILHLRKMATATRNDIRGTRNETQLLALTVKAWNLYRDGATVKLLSWKQGGARPEAFPEPH